MVNHYINTIVVNVGNPGDGGTFTSGGARSESDCHDPMEFKFNPAAVSGADSYHDQMLAALAVAPVKGSTITTYGGTVDVQLHEEIEVTGRIDTTFVFSGARISCGSNARMFSVKAKGTRFMFPHFYWPDNIDSNAHCIMFDDTSTPYASNGGLVYGGRFELGCGNNSVLNFAAIRVQGNLSSSRHQRGVVVQACEFLAMHADVGIGVQQQFVRSPGGVPYGVIGVAADNCVGVQVMGCSFRGEAFDTTQPPQGFFGRAIYFNDAIHSHITGNVFTDADVSTSLEGYGPAIEVVRGSTEGGHVNITGNNSENFSSEPFVLLDSVPFVNITGNNFGRNWKQYVRSDGPANTLVITGNNFHNPGGGDPCIVLNDTLHAVVSGNVASIMPRDEPFVRVGDGCANIYIDPNTNVESHRVHA